MCHIFASQSPASYAFETHSIRLNGQSTSIRLEKIFWTMLGEIAAGQGYTVPKFISTLHSEILSIRGEVPNFTSHLRCICLVALKENLHTVRPIAPTKAAEMMHGGVTAFTKETAPVVAL
jgi:predicted DNA-binding ribbon-helix-helix protein